MAVLDERGRLFGVVNVIDAAVVLIVLVVLLAGGVLVLAGGPGQRPTSDGEPTRYATIAFSAPLETDAAALAAGDVVRPEPDAEGYVVTDVYHGLPTVSDAYVVARLRYNGTFSDGGRLYAGESGTMVTGDTRLGMNVLAVDRRRPSIRTTTVPVTLSVNDSKAVTDRLAAGQRVTVRNVTVATVEGVTRPGGDRPVQVTIRLQSRTTAAGPVVRTNLLRAGVRLPLVTEAVAVEGHVVDVGDPSDRPPSAE